MKFAHIRIFRVVTYSVYTFNTYVTTMIVRPPVKSGVNVGARWTEEQFHRLSAKSCWQTSDVVLAARVTAGITSKFCEQTARCTELSRNTSRARQSRVRFHDRWLVDSALNACKQCTKSGMLCLIIRLVFSSNLLKSGGLYALVMSTCLSVCSFVAWNAYLSGTGLLGPAVL